MEKRVHKNTLYSLFRHKLIHFGMFTGKEPGIELRLIHFGIFASIELTDKGKELLKEYKAKNGLASVIGKGGKK